MDSPADLSPGSPPTDPLPPFRFFDLPPELRLKILSFNLVLPHTLDLDPSNHRDLAPLLLVFRASRQMRDEAYRVFYGRNTFRLFPVHGCFIATRRPLTARLSPRCRALLTALELRLGPGWGAVPRSWAVRPRLGLGDAKNVRVLRVFVECDPSLDIFKGFRVGKEVYTRFCSGLFDKVAAQVPSLREVQFDGYPSVSRHSSLMTALLARAKAARKDVTWGPLRGWPEEVEEVEEVEGCLATLVL